MPMISGRRLCFSLALGLAIVLRTGAFARSQPAAIDAGASGAWQKIQKLQTTASVMHTTAHPDDEHGGMLAMIGRGHGARVALLTLTRGESGDNAIGPELFDALGLIRTEELSIAARYYGVDRQYFTSVADYGFSKRLDEALAKWGKENVLRDVVRAIRIDRPLVLISRFQGAPRDGHGNHEAAGLITKEAFSAAADPKMFPEQIAEGLRPWQALKLYMGGVRENEDWTIRVDTGIYDPVLGDSYQNVARLGLSYQRSQNSGNVGARPGPSVSYYKRLQSVVAAPAREASFFDGIDATIPGIYRALRKPAPAGTAERLATIDLEVRAAAKAFTMRDPSAAAPALARALAAARAASALEADPDAVEMLRTKEAQIQDAIAASLGIAFTAVAQPAGGGEPAGPFAAFAAPSAMPPVVPGQTFEVRTTFTNRSAVAVTAPKITLTAQRGWSVSAAGALPALAATNEPVALKFAVTVAEDAPLSRPHFARSSIQEPRYTVADPAQTHRPSAAAVLSAVARYEVGGVPVETRVPVTRLETNPPYGTDTRALGIVPAIGVTLSPSRAVVPLAARDKTIKFRAELLHNRDSKSDGVLALRVPAGWTVVPAAQPFQFTRAGERVSYPFSVSPSAIEDRAYTIEAVATAGGREYREGYDVIRHRDLETRYLFRASSARVKGVDVKIAPGLKVGYVMGVGDDVPSGIAQLGVDVQLLGAQELAGADLGRFNAIMTGTRAYGVRDDLRTYNRRLLDYVKEGGHLIVLYNTPAEFSPAQYAPFPGEMPRNAEEVSEEDSPVEILAPDAPVLTAPNRITRADFDDWVEQRGSKFWSAWDRAYTPMLSTWDQGQTPQKGGWLHAKYGKGHYTYFAYAFHRQLPYGVAGAYRLLANLLSLGD
jgi:LmbE family N-acetylglucosaminyl deacetylase